MYQEFISISPSKVVTYEQWQGDRRYSDMPTIRNENLNDNKHKGFMSKAATKRMSNAIDWLLCYADKKKVYGKKRQSKIDYLIGFVTLTLCAEQMHSDKVIKKTLLHQFLTEARWRWGVIHYVWKAERQKNGNIHFHIVTDKFIPYRELRDCWNRIQGKLGYLARFADKHNHFDPNSTDIHSVAKVSNVAAYIKKYMSKHEDEEKIEGNIWGLSYSLSKSKSLVLEMTPEIDKHFSYLKNAFIRQFKELEYCHLLAVSIKGLAKHANNILVKKFTSYVDDLKGLFNSGQTSMHYALS